MSDSPDPERGDRGVTPPTWLVRWAAISWRLIVLGVVVVYAFRLLQSISVVVIAVVVALFLASVLWAPARWLIDRAGWPPLLTSLTVMVGAILTLAGILALVISSIGSNFGDLSDNLTRAWEDLRDWLTTGPLGFSETQIDDFSDSLLDRLREAGSGSILGSARATVEFVGGFFLAVIVTFFVLKDGRRLIASLLDRLPDHLAADIETGLRTGWRTLSRYMAAVAVVGIFDAALIALGLWIVGVPLILPLSILVFFGAFFPLVGAFISGLVAVAVTFANGGPVEALIILAIVVAVQQIEGDVILPLVFGQTLRLHPLVVLLGVAAGGLAFGLLGAFLAVPLIAVAVAVHEALTDGDTSHLTLSRGRR